MNRPGNRTFLTPAVLKNIDWAQLTAVIFLTAAGLVFIRSIGIQSGGGISFFLRQLYWVIGSAAVYTGISCLDYRRPEFRIFIIAGYLISVIMLVVVLFAGRRINGAISWLVIPGTGLSFQPSEFSKLMLITMLAHLFSADFFSPARFRGVIVALGITLLPAGLVMLEPDLGSALVFFAVFAAMVFAAGLKWRYIIIFLLTAITLTAALTVNEFYGRPLLKTYQKNRIEAFFHPEKYSRSAAYQPIQARLAVGAGGITGKGIGEGTQNSLGFITQANNDFIFSVIAEETGFIGCTALFAAYSLLLYSMLRTAFLATDFFGKYISAGMSAMIFCHLFINTGMSLGVTPVTGLPLPFVSYGGSFYLMLATGCAVLQSVYRHEIITG